MSVLLNILLFKNIFKMATQPKIFLDEEKITKLIKEVFEEEFKKQEVDITKIISSNFTLTIKEIKNRSLVI